MKKFIVKPKNHIVSIRIVASSQYSSDDAGLINMLRDMKIDTTFHRYELYAQNYERYEDGKKYRLKFKCPGDYLALYAGILHETPNYENMESYFGDIDDIAEYVEDYPTVSSIQSRVDSYSGDGGDFIIYLKNLDTGDYLYSVKEPEDEYEDEYDWE